MSVEHRMKQLQELTDYVSSAQRDLKAIVSRLGWSLDYKSNDGTFVHCPRNAEHRVPVDRLQKHIESCTWRSEGYHDSDLPLPDACDSGAGKNSIIIDSQLANAIIQEAVKMNPQMKTRGLRSVNHPTTKTADRVTSDFTTDERRAIYDYVVLHSEAKSVKLEELNFSFQTENKGGQPKSLMEVLAAERDAKRRRISHRTKKVSTNRKSHIEVMREVIQNQMELYQEWLAKDEKQDKEEIYNENKAEDPDVSRHHGKERDKYVRKWDNQHGNSSKSYTSRASSHAESQDSRQSSHSYKYPNNKQCTRTSRDRSRDRDSSKHRTHGYSSQRKRYRTGSRDNSRSRSMSKDKHKTRKEDSHREKGDRKEKSNREESGRKANEKKEEVTKEKVKSIKRKEIQSVEDCEDASMFIRSRENDFEPCKIIKTEKLDQLSNSSAPSRPMDKNGVEDDLCRKEIDFNIDTSSCAGKDIVSNIRDLPNEWSEDSEKSVSKKHIKRAKKKEKKSKHKRKKHGKKSKHSRPLSSDIDSSDFSC